MKKSTMFITVRLEIEHQDDIDPGDIVAEADYNVSFDDGENKIVETEIVESDWHSCLDA